MVEITIRYDGNLRCSTNHGPSGTTLQTDAPKDNHGLGESFSPTDLVATALATCGITIMGILAQKEGIDLTGVTATIQKGMVADPRRIGSLPMVVRMPSGLTQAQREQLEEAARNCPVAKSIHSEIDAVITFEYPDE